MSKEWFDWYTDQLDIDKKWAKYRDRYLCPCCYMPTLEDRGSFDICSICDWEDDGQDSADADIVRGGPNGNYSLSEARQNFSRYFTSYRPSHIPAFKHASKEIESKKKMYQAFSKAMKSNEDTDWEYALQIEQQSNDKQ